jgi:hypothetical protein
MSGVTGRTHKIDNEYLLTLAGQETQAIEPLPDLSLPSKKAAAKAG